LVNFKVLYLERFKCQDKIKILLDRTQNQLELTEKILESPN